jgi:ABC-type sugar transport system ATPase subunit
MDNLHIEGVSVTFPGQRAGEEVHALEGISLTVDAGAFVVVVGSSGCGKTTLLNLMAGFISPSSGEILLGDKGLEAEHTSPPPLSLQQQLVQDSLLIPIKWNLRSSINDCFGNIKW